MQAPSSWLTASPTRLIVMHAPWFVLLHLYEILYLWNIFSKDIPTHYEVCFLQLYRPKVSNKLWTTAEASSGFLIKFHQMWYKSGLLFHQGPGLLKGNIKKEKEIFFLFWSLTLIYLHSTTVPIRVVIGNVIMSRQEFWIKVMRVVIFTFCYPYF